MHRCQKIRPKALHVDRLVLFPFKKSLEIAVKSIRVRLLRSLITTLSLILAIAFLGSVQVGNDIASGLAASDMPRIRQQLMADGYDLTAGGSITSSAKQQWIVVLSLLVCVVGIVNAQLMAVTERFREIGTMKCLGALDRFILRLFLLEAGIQGLSGSIVGAVLGAAAALINGLLRYGSAAVAYLPGVDLLHSLGVCLAVGVVLSLVGVFYPALLAARMQPVEAMRIEQ
jgi:putative ABC transport system permease protein